MSQKLNTDELFSVLEPHANLEALEMEKSPHTPSNFSRTPAFLMPFPSLRYPIFALGGCDVRPVLQALSRPFQLTHLNIRLSDVSPFIEIITHHYDLLLPLTLCERLEILDIHFAGSTS